MLNSHLFRRTPASVALCFWLGFFMCVGVLGFALYLEQALKLAPCPLCQLQRFMFLTIGFLYLFAALQKPHRFGVIVYASLISLFAAAGAGLAGYQLWLQAHPPAVSGACGVGLGYLLDTLSFSQAMKIAIMGTADCAIVTWRLFGLSIPAYSLMGFIAVGLLALYQIRRVPRF